MGNSASKPGLSAHEKYVNTKSRTISASRQREMTLDTELAFFHGNVAHLKMLTNSVEPYLN